VVYKLWRARAAAVLAVKTAAQGAVDVANTATTKVTTADVAAALVAKTAVTLQEFTEDTKAVADAYTASVEAAAEAISANAVENAAELAISTTRTAARGDADLCIVPSPPPPPTSPPSPPSPLSTSTVKAMTPVKAVVSGSVMVEGYTVDTFGENETTAFAKVMGDLLNVSSDDVDVTVATATRRRILSSNVAISYTITVPDIPAAETLLATIKAVPPTDLVVRLKAEGLKEVSNVVVKVSDTIAYTEPITEPAPAEAPAPAPQPEVAPDMGNYVVGAVDIFGITPETFGVNGTIVFENTTAEAVGLTPPSVKIVTVDDPPEEEADDTYEASEGRRRLLTGFGGATRVRFVIKAGNQEIASSVRTLLKLALRDNPERFAESLRSNGLETVTGVLEVPPDLSTARKTLTANREASRPSGPSGPSRPSKPSEPSEPSRFSGVSGVSGATPPPPSAPMSPKIMDERLAIALVCVGFVPAMTVALACFAALNRKGGHTVTMPGAKAISLFFYANTAQSHRNYDSRGGCTDAPEYVTRKTVRSRRVPYDRMSE
jgi:hypothetical protein